jgi:hypothetical protein
MWYVNTMVSEECLASLLVVEVNLCVFLSCLFPFVILEISIISSCHYFRVPLSSKLTYLLLYLLYGTEAFPRS